MTRLARDFSWHVVALVLVVAGLGVLAPLAWWQTRERRSVDNAAHLPDPPEAGAPWAELLPPPLAVMNLAEPQMAPLRPLVADEIRLDPSVTETPALPAAPSATADQQLFGDPSGDLRLSAARPSVNLPPLQDSKDLTALREPLDSPGTKTEGPLGAAPPTKAWPYPAGLIAQLQALADSTPPAAGWTAAVRADLDRLIRIETLTDPAVGEILANLRKLAACVARSEKNKQGQKKKDCASHPFAGCFSCAASGPPGRSRRPRALLASSKSARSSRSVNSW
jgi:hypothetical protein